MSATIPRLAASVPAADIVAGLHDYGAVIPWGAMTTVLRLGSFRILFYAGDRETTCPGYGDFNQGRSPAGDQ